MVSPHHGHSTCEFRHNDAIRDGCVSSMVKTLESLVAASTSGLDAPVVMVTPPLQPSSIAKVGVVIVIFIVIVILIFIHT